MISNIKASNIQDVSPDKKSTLSYVRCFLYSRFKRAILNWIVFYLYFATVEVKLSILNIVAHNVRVFCLYFQMVRFIFQTRNFSCAFNVLKPDHEVQKTTFSQHSKYCAFKLNMSQNVILTSESKRTPHFWSGTNLARLNNS